MCCFTFAMFTFLDPIGQVCFKTIPDLNWNLVSREDLEHWKETQLEIHSLRQPKLLLAGLLKNKPPNTEGPINI
jgi:hypothetical protein